MTSPRRVRRLKQLTSLLVAGALAAALAPVAAQAAGDTTPPTTTVTAPTKNQALPAGTATIAGISTDNLSGISSAQVAIKDRVAGTWWDPTANAWGAGLKWITTTLTSPGAPTTTWSYGWTGGVAGGSYFTQARATDTSSNVSKAPFASVNFTETTGGSGDSGAVPNFVKTLGGPGHATIYPSGMEIASDGTVVIADTGNSHILKYAADGTTLLWKIGSDGAGTGQFNNPRDVGVDSAGNIYVADT